jgi:nitroimidazol reductase NimA-like FMN-containing flavoprotein (pyridoxamine 5'-phosphate oxidase superfamily)
MPKDYAVLPVAEVRRRDRAIEDEEWIRAFLRHAPVGTFATVHEGQPFINSNLFVYDEATHAIYFHTARVGRTQANVVRGERICFSIFEMGRMLPAKTALEFSVEYSGVVAFGAGSQIDDAEQATRALQLLLDKYAPHLRPDEDYRPVVKEELARTAVFCLQIEQWSGKKKVAAEDFPGAFVYPISFTNA